MIDSNPLDFTGEKGFNPLPSMFTLCNGLCGLTSIVFLLKGGNSEMVVPLISLLLIGGAMLFDVLDGLAARLLDARSMHGLHLDSLADAVSFGVAPSMVIYQLGLKGLEFFPFAEEIAWLVAGFYLGCALWRLAAYNTRLLQGSEKPSKAVFIGLPSPGAAAAICSMVFVLPACLPSEPLLFFGYMIYGTIAALLMVSSVPYPHVRIFIEKNSVFMTVFLVALLAASLVFMKIWALVLWAHLYIFAVPVVEMVIRINRRYELMERLRYLVGR